MVLSVPLNLTFTTEQTKSIKLKRVASQPEIADVPHLDCHSLATEEQLCFSSGLVQTQLTLPTQAQTVNSPDSHE